MVRDLNLQLQLKQLFGALPQLLIAPLPCQLVAEGIDAIAEIGTKGGFGLNVTSGGGDGAVASGVFSSN